MRVENHKSNQQFCSLNVRDKCVMKFIKRRVNSKAEFNTFRRLINSQKDNHFNIELGMVNTDGREHLNAYIYDGYCFYRPYKESVFGTYFSPIWFIKKVCSDANKILAEYKKKLIQNI